MYDRLPDTLFRTKRGLCPSCGAPLPLGEDASNIACGFCGGRAVLERRLRRAEPEVPGQPLRQFDSHDHAGWERTDRLRESYASRATCPGCGQGIDEPEHGSRFACPSCGTECHLERRLVPPARDPARGVPRPRHPREAYVYDLRDDEDPRTEHLIYRLAREQDEERATALATWFERWNCINPTTSRLMPAILERMHRAGAGGHRPLVFELSNAVDKCLCSEGVQVRDTIEALEEWVVRVPAERRLISSLGLGPALGLKLLMDSSMLAYRAGDIAQSVACLFGINWMLQRNYPEHPIISQILMHRMFYLSGPPLAFCVMFMHGQVSDVAFRYDPRSTLAFLDDAVAERPCLVPSLDHERAFWCAGAGDVPEWEQRWAFAQTLRTDEARRAAWRWYLDPPEAGGPEFWEKYVGLVLGAMDSDDPEWRRVGEHRLERVIRRVKPVPECVLRLARERGESLPGEVRRAFVGEVKDCGLKYSNLPDWKSEPKPVEHPEVVEARRLYREGLDAHLDGAAGDREAWKAFWDARGGRPTSPPEVFDGSSEAPAPDESRRGKKRRYPRPWENEESEPEPPDQAHDDVRDGRPAPGDETAPPEEQDPAAEDGTPAHQSPQQGQSVTLWEYVASLPPEQRAQYDDVLKQMEPHRAMIEAAMAQQRAMGSGGAAGDAEARPASHPPAVQSPSEPEGADRPPPPGPPEEWEYVDWTADRPYWRKKRPRVEPPSRSDAQPGSKPPGLLDRLFRKKDKPSA